MGRNKFRVTLITLLFLTTTAAAVILVVFGDVMATMYSITKIDDYPMYTMVSKNDYGIDRLMNKGGASSEKELVEFIISDILRGLPVPIEYEVPNLGCTTFTATTPDGDRIFGRNHDNNPTPVCILFTAPENGYRSVSGVNLSFLGYTNGHIPDRFIDRLNAMAAPFFPLDGVNEKGLAVAVLQVMTEPTSQNSELPDINTTMAIRLMLDKAASVNEAVNILKKHDMHAAAGGCFQFHITDSTGKSVVVSYDRDIMVITPTVSSYQVCANFYLYRVPFDYTIVGSKRFQTAENILRLKKGIVTEGEAMNVLEMVHADTVTPDETGTPSPTQWSEVFNITKRTLSIAVGRNYKNIYSFSATGDGQYMKMLPQQ